MRKSMSMVCHSLLGVVQSSSSITKQKSQKVVSGSPGRRSVMWTCYTDYSSPVRLIFYTAVDGGFVMWIVPAGGIAGNVKLGLRAGIAPLLPLVAYVGRGP